MAAPLTNLVGEAPWTWSAAQDLAFEETQRAIDQARQLTIRQEELAPRESEPIHFGHPPTTAVRNPVSGKYIFLQCDASTVGTSACVMYGENWWNAQPVYHHSRKLTGAQLNYPVHEIELLAIYEGFQKYRNILFGRRVIVLTNNNSLTSFLTAKEVNDRQARAYAFMSRFAFSIRHIDGECNHVPDMLSRQYENDNLAEGYVEDGRLDDLDTERDDGPLLFDRSLGAMTASTKAKGKGKAPDRPGAKAKTTRRPSGKRAAKAKAARLKEEGRVPSRFRASSEGTLPSSLRRAALAFAASRRNTHSVPENLILLPKDVVDKLVSIKVLNLRNNLGRMCRHRSSSELS